VGPAATVGTLHTEYPPHTSFKQRQGEERACHVPFGSGPCLPVEAGSRSATCPTGPNLASLLGRALLLPHVTQFQTLLPAREGSSATTCHTALDPASLLRRAPLLSRVTRLWTPPLCSGRLWCCHVPHDSGPYLPAREGSSVVTCPATLRGPRALRIKKCLAGLPMRLGSCVLKARQHVFKTPDT
jgi:hypothetical protein